MASKNGGHKSMAGAGDPFNMSEPAFEKGLRDAGYAWPTGAPGATIDEGFGKGESVPGASRFGDNRNAQKAGSGEALSERADDAN